MIHYNIPNYTEEFRALMIKGAAPLVYIRMWDYGMHTYFVNIKTEDELKQYKQKFDL